MTTEKLLDARGLSCPMPIMKTKQEISHLQPGDILKVLATDRGSVKDFQAWAKIVKNVEILKQETENQEGKEVYITYIKKNS